MEWNQMYSFLIVAQEENFSRAAQLLHTSQPSLSQTVKRLEEELGYQLFDREGKRIRLNEAGKEWMHTVQQMKELYDNTRLKLEEKHEMQHPEVSIYIGCASTLLPGLLQYLRKRNPGIQYQIHQWNITSENREKHIQILAENTEWAGDAGQRSVQAYTLMEEQIVLAVPVGHSLLEKKRYYAERFGKGRIYLFEQQLGTEQENYPGNGAIAFYTKDNHVGG